MPLDLATVRRVASLARIRLGEDEIVTMQAELNGILGWIEELQAVDTDGVEPMAGGAPVAAVAMRMREDVVTEGDQAGAVLGNAPERIGDSFAVPKVVE